MTQRGRADIIFGIDTGRNTGKVFGIGLSWRVRRGGVILSEQTEQYMNQTVYEPHGTVYVAHSMFTSICSTQYMLNTAQYMNRAAQYTNDLHGSCLSSDTLLHSPFIPSLSPAIHLSVAPQCELVAKLWLVHSKTSASAKNYVSA